MTRTEERLRNAFTGAARTVRQSDLRPLTVAPPRPRHAIRWVAPVVAALSVVAVVVGGLTIRDDEPNMVNGVMTARAAPRFFLSVEAALGKTTRTGQEFKPAVARVRSAETGAVVATVASVPGVAWDADIGLTAVPGGQAYVLRGMSVDSMNDRDLYRAYLVRLDGSGTPSRPKELAIAPLRDQVSVLAVSPDARLIAYVLGTTLGVADVTSGRVRTWTGRITTQPILQWTADGHHLQAVYQHGNTQARIQTFDPRLRGGKVTGRIALPAGRNYLGAMLYGDQYILETAGSGAVTIQQGSLATGQIVGTIGFWTLPTSEVIRTDLWTMDPSTGHLLLDIGGRLTVRDLRTGQTRTLPTVLPTANRIIGW